jgi:hypothetical protein
MILYLQVGFEFIYDIRALKWKIRQLSVHFGVLRSKHGHHNLLSYCVTVEKYLNLQNTKRNNYVCRFSKYSLVHKCRNHDCVHCTEKDLPHETVDCSFIKVENSTHVSLKNNSRKNACIAKQFAVPPPVSQSFHLPFVEQSQVPAHLLFAAQCIT